jgi:hypothetical protein
MDIDFPRLPEEVVKTLSKDRKYVYLMCLSMVTGEFTPTRLPYWRCGKLHSARWLTMAGRALRLRASQPFAHAYEQEKLERLCVFIVGVYYKVRTLFTIKWPLLLAF